MNIGIRIFLLLAVFLSGNVYGFKPTEGIIFKKGHSHSRITSDMIRATNIILGDGSSLNMSDDAIEEVVDANTRVDENWGTTSGTFWSAKHHCDAESIGDCTDRIKKI